MVKSTCVITGEGVKGVIHFTQDKDSDALLVEGKIEGLKEGKHGFHIHQFGDLTNGCLSAGPHFNPNGKTHGAPENDERHVGDFGNVVAGSDGVSSFKFTDKLATLFGKDSIIGRTMVIHADEDDLGKGNNEDTKKTGNAGARLGCGIIGISQ